MTGGIPIRTAGVIGAGTMGAQIAAHLANAGVPVVLLDVSREAAADGLKRASGLKPDPLFTRDALGLIATGGLDRDFERLATVDWIVEAVVERLDIKRQLFERLETVRAANTMVSSNTSGIPITLLAEGRSHAFRQHFLGTHFFNPPRYLRLVEVIPTVDTDGGVLRRLSWFIDHRLGKGVVVAKDAPNFIANRIGLFGTVATLRALERGGLSIEDIDAITGPAIGRPRSATFRTMDIAGIDVVHHVLRNLVERLAPPEATQFAIPPLITQMVERGWIGEKTGQGFYKKVGSEILTLDPTTLEYRARQAPKLPALDHATAIDDVRERISTLFLSRDLVGAFLRDTLGATLVYAAQVTPEIAHTIDDVDRAMQWGFGWAAGPFEIWDAIGINQVLEAMAPATVPPLVADAIRSGSGTFRTGPLPPASPGLQILKAAKDRTRVIRKNAGASLVDLDDGVMAVEFHSKLNVIGGDTVQMLDAGLREAATNGTALVIGNDATDFSAGANLMLVLLEAQEGNWEEIDLMVRSFQRTNMALKYADVPVVVAPAGLALGGGCEITLHGACVCAAAELYIGLVEVGVGLIPAGGGTKEMLARAMLGVPDPHAQALPFAQRVFETIAFARVSSSGPHARQLGYLRDRDSITMNRERLIADAKQRARDLAAAGYQRPSPGTVMVGGEDIEAALKLGVHLASRAGRISDHDALIGRTLAHVVAGGRLPRPAAVTEEHLLDLEREAFLKLCGERKTLERIQYTLRTGKTLRN